MKAERKEERDKEKGMKKEEASLVCEDMGKESSPRGSRVESTIDFPLRGD